MIDSSIPLVMGVDDDEQNLKLLQAIVESGGYRFVSAASGKEALEKAQQLQPRIILLDVVMRGMNGFELALRLRTDIASTAPIIYVTARQGQEDIRGGLAAGGNDFVLKPFEKERLLSRIEVWLAKAHTVTAQV